MAFFALCLCPMVLADDGAPLPTFRPVQERAAPVRGSLVETCTPRERQRGKCKSSQRVSDSAIRTTAEEYNESGSRLLAVGLLDEAIAEFDHAIAMRPDFAEAFNNRGSARFASRAYGEALADLDKALSLDPRLVSALFNRGQTYNAMGRFDDAIRDFNGYIAATPDDPDAYFNRAYAYRQTGQYELAIADQTKTLRFRPRDPIVLNARCWTRAVADIQLKAALSDCNASLRLRPGGCQTLDSRGFVLFRLKRYDRAIADNTAALEINPSAASSLYIRGLAKLRQGDRLGSVADIAAAEALDRTIAATYLRYGVQP